MIPTSNLLVSEMRSFSRPLLWRGVRAQARAGTRAQRQARVTYSTTTTTTTTSPVSLAEKLHHELTTRKIPLFYDYLHPQPSHLLNLTLANLLPQPSSETTHPSSPSQTQAQTQTQTPPALPSIHNPSPLPLAHHLIYFPPQVSLSQLLPDGTDTLHTPGDPFNRRLWAGGNIRLTNTQQQPLLDGHRAVCLESIRNVTVKGLEGEEKVIVTIERRIANVNENEDENTIRRRVWTEDQSLPGDSSLVENRDLIFMRAKSAEQIRKDKELFGVAGRIVKSPSDAVFRHKILPTKSLLFRFSALTFNAHSIHLDKNYTQNEEGYRNCLVHGPLTLTLLLSVLQGHLRTAGLQVSQFEYRNLAPLFVEEEMTVCGKPKMNAKTKDQGGVWDVWIEGPDGGLAVRGTARTCGLV